MTSYNDTEIGDKVLIIGTVTDVSECGVQTIEVPKDSEGFVITHKLTGKLKEAMLDELGSDCGLSDSCGL